MLNYFLRLQGSVPDDTRKHFQEVAPLYRQLRTTDKEPVLAIKKIMGKKSAEPAADVGCGAGSYTQLFSRILKPKLLFAVDASRAMLSQCFSFLSGEERDVQAAFLLASANHLPMAAGILGYLIAFNAIHHFKLPFFLEEAARVLQPGGLVFIYTRLKEQNERTIWGTLFPKFAKKETRLFSLEEFERAVAEAGQFVFREIKFFRFERRSNWESLKAQAKGHHYSTFSLYKPEEFKKALEEFYQNLQQNFSDLTRITHTSENTLLVLEKTI